MKKYETCVISYAHPNEQISLDSFQEDFINKSEEGWQLCSVIKNKWGMLTAFYQRELP